MVHAYECWGTCHEGPFPPGRVFFQNFTFFQTLSLSDPDVSETIWRHGWIAKEFGYNILFPQNILLPRSKFIHAQSWWKMKNFIFCFLVNQFVRQPTVVEINRQQRWIGEDLYNNFPFSAHIDVTLRSDFITCWSLGKMKIPEFHFFQDLSVGKGIRFESSRIHQSKEEEFSSNIFAYQNNPLTRSEIIRRQSWKSFSFDRFCPNGIA